MQFYKNYFKEINDQLAPNFLVNSDGSISSINFPLEIQDTERKKLLLYLWKINDNRSFILNYYTQVEKKIIQIREKIKKEINIK